MELARLAEQNPWWRARELVRDDYDLVKWGERTPRWVPALVEGITLEPFAFHVISGARQSGKTTALKLLIRSLLEKGTEPKSIFFFNCEDVSGYAELLEVFDAYFTFRESCGVASSVFVLDEVTLPKEWYRAVKSLIDKGRFQKDVLIATGSASMVVKREVELFPGRRGNGKDYVLYPLSFRGFLKVEAPELASKIKPMHELGEIPGKAKAVLLYRGELDRHLQKYMSCGGFPLSVSSGDASREDAKRAYLSWIKNAVLKAERSDVIARQVLKAVVETLQSDVSWEGISKKIEVKSPKTVSAYVDFLKSIYAVNVLYNIDANAKSIRFGKNKKIHFRDPLLLEIFEDWCLARAGNREAAIAEGLVVEHLSRLFPESTFFWKNGFEVDAVVQDSGGRLHGFEVKWTQTPRSPKVLQQLKTFTVVTKKDYSSKPPKIPLSVFLSLFDV